MSTHASHYLAGLFGEPDSPSGPPKGEQPAAVAEPVAIPMHPEAIRLDADGWPVDSVPADWTCPRCGGIAAWWDLLGGEHCMSCEADTLARSHRLAERAAVIRAEG